MSSRGFLASPNDAAIDADVEWIEQHNATLIPCTSPDYPQLLARTSRAPAVLYVLGDPNVLHIVAARHRRLAKPDGERPRDRA